jgi:hypothetical protein
MSDFESVSKGTSLQFDGSNWETCAEFNSVVAF